MSADYPDELVRAVAAAINDAEDGYLNWDSKARAALDATARYGMAIQTTAADKELLRDLIRTDLAAFDGWVEYTYRSAEDERDDLAERRARLESLRDWLSAENPSD